MGLKTSRYVAKGPHSIWGVKYITLMFSYTAFIPSNAIYSYIFVKNKVIYISSKLQLLKEILYRMIFLNSKLYLTNFKQKIIKSTHQEFCNILIHFLSLISTKLLEYCNKRNTWINNKYIYIWLEFIYFKINRLWYSTLFYCHGIYKYEYNKYFNSHAYAFLVIRKIY